MCVCVLGAREQCKLSRIDQLAWCIVCGLGRCSRFACGFYIVVSFVAAAAAAAAAAAKIEWVCVCRSVDDSVSFFVQRRRRHKETQTDTHTRRMRSVPDLHIINGLLL